MRVSLLSAAMAVALAVAPLATAQAGGSLKDAPDHQQCYNFSGGYIGAHGGGFSGQADYDEPQFPNFGINRNLDGFVGGALIGYNHKVNRTVYGVEADIGFGDISAGADANAVFNDYTAFDMKWNGHMRARVGYCYGSTLFFVAGGLALARLEVDDIDPNFGKVTNTHVGWSIGAGLEHALSTGQHNILLRAEWLYDDYGSKGGNISFFGAPSYDVNTDLTGHTVRGALIFKFN